MRRAILYVMAKSPLPGRVKTRLCPPLTPEQAARLAGAFAADTLARLAAIQGIEVRLALDAHPTGIAAAASTSAISFDEEGILTRFAQSRGITVTSQGEGDLGERMGRLLARGLEQGVPTILVGSDVPDLPCEHIEAALDALRRVDVIIGPARDGGYVLIGASRDTPGLFRIDAPWSSDRVCAATLAALTTSGATFKTLPQWEDVDDAAALGRLADRLESGGAAVAPATASLLGCWRREGVRF